MVKILRRSREQLPIMIDFAEQIERELEAETFDKRQLWPAIYEARQHSAKLKAWLAELHWLTSDHS